MIRLLRRLYQVNLLSPKGLVTLVIAFVNHGVNLMALLQFSAKMSPSSTAIQDDEGAFTYTHLFQNSYRLAIALNETVSISKKSRVAFLCRNHTVCILSLFAFSRLGADIAFLNIDLSSEQIKRIIKQNKFSFIIYDNDLADKINCTNCPSLPCFVNGQHSIEDLVRIPTSSKTSLPRKKSGKISVLTGGTSGRVKWAKRQPSILNLAMPFLSLLNQLSLHKYRSVYIGVPLYHGYGLAAYIVALILNAKVCLKKKYKTQEVVDLLGSHKIEIAVLVPTMLKRMLDLDPESMKDLKGILSGGAPLNSNLVRLVEKELGNILFNLYGTSETGIAALAVPRDLAKYPDTIGKRILGVSLKIGDESGRGVKKGRIGTIHIKTAWSMENRRNSYVSTGDLGYENAEGYLFLKGREDDMIVSGGENVYPRDLELQLLKNQQVKEVAIIGVEDADFGRRLLAFVVLEEGDEMLKSGDIKDWLSARVARYQMPYKIMVIDSLPFTATGKIDKSELWKKSKQIK